MLNIEYQTQSNIQIECRISNIKLIVLSHITYERIRTPNGQKKKCKKMFIRCSSGDKSRLGGDDGLRGTCKERIKRMSNALYAL